MSALSGPRMQGERGASLILAIAFMVVIGAITAAVLSTAASGLQDRAALDGARNREYAADGAIETMIAAARGAGGTCQASTTPSTNPFNLDNVSIHVDCSSAPAVIVGPGGVLLTQNNLSFVACVNNGQACGLASTPAIITAQVNFQGSPTKSFVQSWSVNR